MDTPKKSEVAWYGSILAALMVSPEAAALCAIGIAAQWAKAQAAWSTSLVMLGSIVVCFGVFALFHPPGALPPSNEWFKLAAMWAGTALSLGSFAGATGGAPKTDSR